MKNSMIVFLIIGLAVLSSCKQKPDVNTLLKNQDTKNEIFNTIADNHDYMIGFMETMGNSDHAMLMMQENKIMMRNMMKEQGMQMMMGDSTVMKSMMQKMMQHKNIKHSMMKEMITDSTKMKDMMKMMHQKGMMNKECMQSCMKMMKNKKQK